MSVTTFGSISIFLKQLRVEGERVEWGQCGGEFVLLSKWWAIRLRMRKWKVVFPWMGIIM